ncbi:MAG TPA: lipopolysaccharide assembly protein LapA domain-containing protein [Dokdonella sp.]
MRLILIVAVLLVVGLGALFGALNAESIPVDLYFFAVHVPTGLALLGSLLLGWLLGGLVAWFGQVPRLRRELRKARQQLREQRIASGGEDA